MSFAQQASVLIPAPSSGTIIDADIYVKISDAKLKPSGSGGLVQVSGTSPTGETVPFDLTFTSDAAATSLFNWSIKYWDQSAGIVYARIRQASYSASFTVYANVGDGTIVGYQGGTIGQDLASNVKGDWPLGNGTTLNIKDFSSNGQNGVATSVTATSGQIDGGGSFGSTSKIAVGATGSGSGSNVPLDFTTFTYTAWIKCSSFSTNEDVINGGASGMPQFRVLTTGALRLSNTNVADLATSTSTISLNTWTHIAISFDGSTGAYVFYINGVAVGSGSVTVPAGWTLSNWSFIAHTWLIGRINSNPSYVINDVRIYNAIISANQLLTYYQNGNSIPLFGSFASSGATLTFSETFSINETLNWNITKKVTDVISLVETYKNGIAIRVRDSLILTDLIYRNIHITFAENTFLSDLIKFTRERWNYLRNYLNDPVEISQPSSPTENPTSTYEDTEYIKRYL